MDPKDIRILVFTRDYPSGMAGTKRVQHLLHYLCRQNITVKVLSLRGKMKQSSIKGDDNGISYESIGYGLEFRILNLHRIAGYFFRGLQRVSGFRNRKSCNFIYCYETVSIENLPLILWARILGYKFVFDIDEDFSFFDDNVKLISRFKFWTVRRLDKLTCRIGSGLIVISSRLFNKYTRQGAKNIVLVPITANLNYNPGKRSFNDPLQVVYAGSFGDKDGVSDIIEGFNLFNSSYGNARLILTGKSDEQAAYVKKYIDFPNLIFTGRLSDDEFYTLLRNADAMCMCRIDSEFANAGFPFKLGEYLATGNPVISTRASDIEYYLTSDDVFFVDSGSPGQICSALTEIVNKPEKARRVGLSGLEKCKKFFSPESNGKLLYDLLTGIQSGKLMG